MQPAVLATARLRLRPSVSGDAVRAFAIQSDWDVTRMLSMASFPPNLDDLTAWFATHEQEWTEGNAYRFAVERDGAMIGLVDLDQVTATEATLGYWLEQAAWGRRFGLEAAQAIVQFAFAELRLERLKAGHAADNRASGRILMRLGFRFLDVASRHSKSRGGDVLQWRYVAERPEI
ncbi:MAG: GNAT family N-acetyltransferase [Devosia sp.]